MPTFDLTEKYKVKRSRADHVKQLRKDLREIRAAEGECFIKIGSVILPIRFRQEPRMAWHGLNQLPSRPAYVISIVFDPNERARDFELDGCDLRSLYFAIRRILRAEAKSKEAD